MYCAKLIAERVTCILNDNSELFDKKDFDLNYLPRNVDVLSYIYYLKENAPYHKKFEKLYQTVANKIFIVWDKTQIPVLAHGNKKHGDTNMIKRIGNVMNT